MFIVIEKFTNKIEWINWSFKAGRDRVRVSIISIIIGVQEHEWNEAKNTRICILDSQ